jgi:hypothetical protein
MSIAALGMSTFWLSPNMHAAVLPYPPPKDLSPIAHLAKSEAYAVTIRGRSGAEQACFVYASDNYASGPKRSQEAVSFTSFAFAEEPVTVKVTCQARIESVVIRPKRLAIQPVVKGDTITFTLEVPRKISLEVNDQKHPLLLFAEAPEILEPKADHYFAPGTVTRVGNKFEIKEGQSVYIAGGAVVEGTLLCTGHNNRFHGRGILSSGHISWEAWKADKTLCQFSYPTFRGVRSNDFNGLILLNTPGWTQYGELVGSTVREVKQISWNGNSDGLHLGGRSTMEDCFFFNNDDCLIANNGNDNAWRRCTIWRGPWGHPIISLLTKRKSKNYLWEDIDIIGMEGTGPMITLKNYKNWGSNGSVEDFTVRRVRIESPRLGPLVKVESSFCSVKNFLLEDVSAETTVGNEGLLAFPGEGSPGTMEFRNVVLAGAMLTGLGNSKMTPKGDVSGVKFSGKPQ